MDHLVGRQANFGNAQLAGSVGVPAAIVARTIHFDQAPSAVAGEGGPGARAGFPEIPGRPALFRRGQRPGGLRWDAFGTPSESGWPIQASPRRPPGAPPRPPPEWSRKRCGAEATGVARARGSIDATGLPTCAGSFTRWSGLEKAGHRGERCDNEDSGVGPCKAGLSCPDVPPVASFPGRWAGSARIRFR